MAKFHNDERCPGPTCRGQFFIIRHYGIICTVKLAEEMAARKTAVAEIAAMQLSQEAHVCRSEGLGLA